MQYMLLIHMDENAMPPASTDEPYAMNESYLAYNAALKKAGAWIAGDRLKPTSLATTVRTRDGKTEVLDGPFAETKEQLGGYYIIEAKDLDDALGWARKCPGTAFGTVELRPIWAKQD